MAATQSALPDAPDRPVCWRCNGDGKRYVRHAGAWHVVEGACLECGGSGQLPGKAQPQPEPDEAEVRQVLSELRRLGLARAEWQDSKVPGAKEERVAIRADIRKMALRGHSFGFSWNELAKGYVGITRQQLNNIMREDPTGRNRG